MNSKKGILLDKITGKNVDWKLGNNMYMVYINTKPALFKPVL